MSIQGRSVGGEGRRRRVRAGVAGGVRVGRLSAMPTRAPGGVSRAGPYHPKPTHSTRTGLAAPPRPTASFSKIADATKRPKGGAAWMSIPDRTVPRARRKSAPEVA